MAAWLAPLAIAAGLAACAPKVDETSVACTWQCSPFALHPGQAATQWIGQTDLFTRVAANPANSTQLTAIGNPAVAGNWLFVADQVVGRVMAFPVTGLTDGEPATFVLGAPDPFSWPGLNPTAKDFGAISVATDGTHLAIVDQSADRVLIYNSIPSTNYAPADVEVGQPSMTNFVPENQSSCDASHFLGAASASLGGGKLVVTDFGNNRVLIWNSIPTVNGQAADLVIGQPNFTSCASNQGSAAPSAATLSTPADAWTDGTNLYVADAGNNRVLLWHGMPTANGQAADAVLGQTDFASNVVPATATASNFGGNLSGISADATSLYVVDSFANFTGFNRVTVFSPIPAAGSTSVTASAGAAIGQTSLTVGGATGTTATTFNNVVGVTSSGSVVYVTDQVNARVLAFSNSPTQITTAQGAANVLGQSTFLTGANSPSQFSTGITPSGMTPGYSVAQFAGYLNVPDLGIAPRIMQYTMPVSGVRNTDHVQGVASNTSPNAVLETGTVRPSTFGLSNFTPGGVATDGTALYFTDTNGNQILSYAAAPTADQLPAIAVAAGPGCTQSTLVGVQGGLAIGGGRLVVPDTFGHRVLIWNSIPTATGTNADLVLGQADFTHCTANHGTTQAARLTARPDSFRFPWNAWTDGTRLLVADEANNRVLGWNSFPTVNGQPADFALGQPDMNTRTPLIPPTQASLRHPFGVTSYLNEIFVADTSNNRVMIWSNFPTTSGVAADSWLGQTDPTKAAGSTSPNGMGSPEGVSIVNGQLWVMDTSNFRIVEFTDQFH